MTAHPDSERFLGLLGSHKRILYKVLSVYCRDREERNDLAQEIVVQLWRSFGRYDARLRFSTWMYRIAVNVAISSHRSRTRYARDLISLEGFGIDLAAADDVMAETSADLRRLHALITQLEEVNRATLLLYLDGYGHEEIAEIVGLSATNVATRIGRIKQELQRALGEKPAK